jgi:6,7-dimethyl-8-ribityllumazine synthase
MSAAPSAGGPGQGEPGPGAAGPGPTVVGSLNGQGLRIGVVASRFNELISERLLAGALDGLRRHGVADTEVTTVWVPGAFELPLAALAMARSGRFDAVITLGAVIRGATTHYDLVAGQAAAGVARAALDSGVPVIFGVLTTETIEQALERAGTKAGNKGFDSAAAAIEMADVLRRLGA